MPKDVFQTWFSLKYLSILREKALKTDNFHLLTTICLSFSVVNLKCNIAIDNLPVYHDF